MTNLEKVLGAGLVLMTTYAVSITVGAIRHVKNDIKFYKEIQAKANEIRQLIRENEEENEEVS